MAEPDGMILGDESSDRKYFILVPQIVWALARDPFDLTLWVVVKMVAGEDNECFLSTPQLARAAGMSVGKVSDCRRFLLSEGLLRGEIRKDPGYPQAVWHITIPDLWATNIVWRKDYNSLKDRIAFKELSPHEGFIRELSCGERGPSPGESKLSPHETKKNPQEEPIEEHHQQHGGVDGWIQANSFDSEHNAAFMDLIDLGVMPNKAAELVRKHPPRQIQNAVDRAANGEIENPAGYVIWILEEGGALLPMKRYRYSDDGVEGQPKPEEEPIDVDTFLGLDA